MIFTSIKHIKGKKEKTFFIEKVNLYIRFVECNAQQSNQNLDEPSINDCITTEMIKIGLIEGQEDLSLLEKVITKSVYNKLISAISYFLSNRELLMPFLYKFRNETRAQLQKDAMKNGKPTMVDFFCGAGGLSLGCCKAGFRVILANDILEECCETYRFNHPELPANKVVQDDIRLICNNINDYISENVDMVVGGPPCQGFSSANRQRIIDDPRNKLYKYFLKAIAAISPKVVIMENVKGMMSVANQVVEDYGAIKCQQNCIGANYVVAYRLLNSADLGVAQNRVRLIYIAIRADIAKAKNISPDTIFAHIEKQYISHPYILSDALSSIKPLESPREKNCTEVDDELTGKKVDINYYSSTANPYLNLINDGRQNPYIFNHKARYASDVNYRIFFLLKQGEDASSERIKNIMPYAHRLHCFKDKYFRLYDNKPCRTITAHLKMDCLSHIHPTQTRTITPREAARVQSFPDDYLFLGAYLKTYMQIGNAVPVIMAKEIAKIIKQYIID